MTTTYVNALGGQNNLNNVPNVNDAPGAGSRGRRFLLQCAMTNTHPNANMGQVNTAFHNFLRTTGWQWAPGVPGASFTAGARLLDGAVHAGECGFPAYALAYLINAPHPYGFGVGGAQVVTYSGANAQGFISDHQGALPGPADNITRPAGGTLPNYYLWDNHKVVQVGNNFYDPSYNRVYVAAAGMAAASLQTIRQNVRLRDISTYNPYSLWSLSVVYGLPRLMALKSSDVLFGTTHQITLLQATNVVQVALTGWYLEWVENWNRPIGGRGTIYGPYTANPLVR